MVTTAEGTPAVRAHDPPRPTTPPAAATGGRLHALDGLRFLAAAGVVLYHLAGRDLDVWRTGGADLFPTLGQGLVYMRVAPELFFVVSGFAILWTAWGRSVPQVVASRLARVYPAYWAALALTTLLFVAVWPQGRDLGAGQVATNATLLQEPLGVAHVDSVYWTLWTELRFYAIVTIFVAVGITRRRVLALAALWPVVAVVVGRLGPGFWPEALLSRHAPYFAGGMLLFLVFRSGHAWLPWLLVATNAGLALWTSLPLQLRAVRAHTGFEADPALMGAAIVTCFAVVALTALSPVRRLRWGFLAGLGALTYPLYLVHQMWGRWVIDRLRDDHPPGVVVAVAVVLAVALAVLVHQVVEQRWNAPLRRRIERALRAWGGRRGRAAGQPAEMPPTGPGGSVPSTIACQNAGVASGSSSTVEPTSPPGR
jgi:peptidoglycan/LPS O-acetylase OafA/YrhL